MTRGKSRGILRRGAVPVVGGLVRPGQAEGDALQKQKVFGDDEVLDIGDPPPTAQLQIHALAVAQGLVGAALQPFEPDKLEGADEAAAAVAEGGSTGVHGGSAFFLLPQGEKAG